MIRPCFPCVSTDKQGQAPFDMASVLSEPRSKLTAYLHAALLPSSVCWLGIELDLLVPHHYEKHLSLLCKTCLSRGRTTDTKINYIHKCNLEKTHLSFYHKEKTLKYGSLTRSCKLFISLKNRKARSNLTKKSQ